MPSPVIIELQSTTPQQNKNGNRRPTLPPSPSSSPGRRRGKRCRDHHYRNQTGGSGSNMKTMDDDTPGRLNTAPAHDAPASAAGAAAGCKGETSPTSSSGGGGGGGDATMEQTTKPATTAGFRCISSTSSTCSSSSSSSVSAPSDHQEEEQDKKPAAVETTGSAAAAGMEEGEGTEGELDTDEEESGEGSDSADTERKRSSCDDDSSSSDDHNESSSSSSSGKHLHHHHRRPRKSARGNISSVASLAKDIVTGQKRVVFVTGAGISVASGVRPFRGATGVWEQHIWTTATRAAFRKDPLEWYNSFFLKSLVLPDDVRPNDGHLALDRIVGLFPSTVRLITQNVDGLHNTFASKFRSVQPIEAHGRLGLYKCLPLNADFDSDTDDDTDEDEDRPVHLGHRRKHRQKTERTSKIMKSTGSRGVHCPYRQHASVPLDCIEPKSTRVALQEGTTTISHPPRCPDCGNILAPQALLFDEGYHSHDFYRFQEMEDWLAEAEVVVFVGTSFQVRLPEAIINHARARGLKVYNFNTGDILASSATLNAANIRGRAEETLPLLLKEVEDLVEQQSAAGTEVPPKEHDEFCFMPLLGQKNDC
mmetsp:Transcript_25048/g.59528  ORF Transcript_25048/g.59528 Transcript_25048/m.59528 type:complete len:592 (+) Transcript_25048:410-2185(+)|eukprot:CAMPEP_0113464010 /NCGR_PEP_ID=MMETSP0014_2-20120614/12968_1 /TAXON_ID=2857 /ORGANISM="Nitzschia sp." /LENGTH=591 /DNA_ID=CAMNT_0000356053 /DNA_START=315 /DNA_END=2090 /DNA_ORIENTATION=+ /assembly_acc=CAM_ASM_000159